MAVSSAQPRITDIAGEERRGIGISFDRTHPRVSMQEIYDGK